MRGFLLVDLFVRATRKRLAMTYVNVISQQRPENIPFLRTTSR